MGVIKKSIPEGPRPERCTPLTKKNNGTLLESSSRSIRGNVIKRISSASKKYSLLELEHAVNVFSQIDIKIKTQKIIDETEFTNIINGVFRDE